MKVWFGFGSEHSANLVIIGTFKTANEAQRLETLIAEARDISLTDQGAGLIDAGSEMSDFTQAMRDYLNKKMPNGPGLNYNDPEQLLYEFDMQRVAEKLIITTEEYEISAFMKMLLSGEAKIEV